MPLSTIFQLNNGGQFLLVKETGAFRENHRRVENFYNFRFVRNLHKMYISYTNTTKVQTLRQLEIQHEKINATCTETRKV